ncbi:PHB depolymerase family esterase [Roseovarius sp. M141]|uniref:extracellular catalytic domain type 1 short-chain-length polyhydroxyalkanoate depolymerase n=1 Tax=Roseovarius sp. M141 TaxID=2583806 RepID=UPI0020CC0DAD|nr:PHB depolymerase family esterase [Roseovarius sp. M141]MCQ0092445.1 PHB depolymerase family esterase [Roseovarius sp. M141]
MKNFNAGAMRPATGDARSARIDAANDLVQRTLAQHGLTSPLDGQAGGAGALPGMDGLLSGLQMPLGHGTARDVPIPAGAAFRSDVHTCAAGARSYRTYVPSTAAGGAAGIVMMLHGCTQTPEDFAIGTGMNALAEARGLIVIYPHQSRGDNAQSCWNWFSPGDQKRGRGEPEILAGMARSAMAEFGVPGERSFVAGLSAGAAMAVILGAAYGDVFAAVGAHSGLPLGAARDVPSAFAAMAGGGPEPQRRAAPARSIVFHGTADTTVHPVNGARIAQQAMDDGVAQSIDTQMAGTRAGRSYRRRVIGAANAAPLLEHWEIEGLGHAWSGGQPGGSYTDGAGPDASAEMIRFFFNEKDL